jgi:ribokinase
MNAPRHPQILVVGGIYLDHLTRAERLPRPGETVAADAYLRAPGGKGANQAVAAARLGAAVAMVGCVGDDEAGRIVLDNLRQHGVDVDGVRTVTGAPTGVAVVQVDRHGEKQIHAVPGATAALTADDLGGAIARLANLRVVVAQLETGLALAERVIAAGRQRGATVILDPSPPVQLSDGLLRQVDLIKPDAAEATLLTGIDVHDRISATQAARRLIDRGAGGAVVQAGHEGDVLLTGRGETWLPRHRLRTVDATGAGDALVGVAAALLADGRPLPEAVTWGSAAAALATTAFGAQNGLPTRDMIMDLLKKSADG